MSPFKFTPHHTRNSLKQQLTLIIAITFETYVSTLHSSESSHEQPPPRRPYLFARASK